METEELSQRLRALRRVTDEELRTQWDRSLPFADALFDRWERARSLGFADGVSIYDSACVFGEVEVGQSTWIGPYVILDGSGGGIRIGAHCSISSGVHLFTHDTVEWALSGGLRPRRTGRVSVGDCTYIGSQTVVIADVRIGDHCVVGANSFVNRDVEPRSVVAGSPIRVVGRVEGSGNDVRIVHCSPKDRMGP